MAEKTRLTLITGGARSGKSRYALALAQERAKGGRAFFLATAQILDAEMAERVARHRSARPARFETVEEPIAVATRLESLAGIAAVAVIDCVTLWVSNLLCAQLSDEAIMAEAELLVHALRSVSFPTIVVSGETGCGIVPENPLARRFRDLLGSVNQLIGTAADALILMVAGYPLRVK
jgi:adenosylcobinamide kinase/adenosylcobinamide-phosphate guanylyltransferase